MSGNYRLQFAGTGVSPEVPHWTVRVVAFADWRMYQVPFELRQTAMSQMPSPS